ncbi:MAG TPA: MDR family MFS transporter [Hyphomicrobiales bacterium]|nr:MDR family MFS transporter [Hyphomicrobiales bacterium]
MDQISAAVTAPAFEPARVRTIILGIMLAMFLAALDQTIVATALPTIGRELHDIPDLSLVVTAYLVATAAVVPLYGKLSDIHGRRTMMMIAIAIFLAGSLACALARSIPLLVVARAFQGLGGGGLFSLSQTVIGDVVPPKERGRYQAYFASVFTTASIGGPILGGFFAEHLHWSLVFWINLPIGVVALMMCDRTLRRLPRHERPHRLDVVGAVLMTASTICLLLALSWAGTTYPWLSFEIVALLAAAVVGWVLFALRLLTAREPFIPIGVMTNKIVLYATASMFFTYGTMIALTIYIPLYFETVVGLTASETGLGLIGFMAGGVVGGFITGWVMVRVEHYKRTPLIGLVISVVALGVLAAGSGSLSFAAAEAAMTIAGGGIGTMFAVATTSIQNAVPRHQLGTATGAHNLFRSLGATLMVAIFGAIFTAGIGAGRAGAHVLVVTPASAALAAGVFREVFFAAALAVAVGYGLFLLMEERPLHLGPPKD